MSDLRGTRGATGVGVPRPRTAPLAICVSLLVACGGNESAAPAASGGSGGAGQGGAAGALAGAGGGGTSGAAIAGLSGAGAHPTYGHDWDRCLACQKVGCPAAWAACDGHPDCVALRGGCPCNQGVHCGPPCATWEAEHVAGKPLHDALVACVLDACGATFCALDAPTCGGHVHSSECAACLSGACCDELKACAAASPSNECGWRGDVAAAAVACSDASCSAQCGVGICESGFFATTVECAACLGATCCEELSTCAMNEACVDCALGSSCNGSQLSFEAVKTCAAACVPSCRK